jgi:hypothetical protein
MIQTLVRMMFAGLLPIFLSSCGYLPKVTLHQIDTVHNQVNPFKITRYNEESCELELKAREPFSLLAPVLHGGVCLTSEDYALLQSKIKARCENAKKN